MDYIKYLFIFLSLSKKYSPHILIDTMGRIMKFVNEILLFFAK